jgi:hypothetical protein
MEQIFKIGAVANASRAKRILTENGIKGRLTKTDDQSEGCAWGIAVGGKDAEGATLILKRAGIRYEVL